jgi:(+)-pinoresinol hydroxylase
MKTGAVAGVMLSILMSAAVQAADDGGQLKEGKKLYDYWCATCHGPGAGNPGQEFLPGTQQLAIKYRGTGISPLLEERTDLVPEFIKLVVRQGISYMPHFRKVEINDPELEALSAYLVRNNPALKK